MLGKNTMGRKVLRKKQLVLAISLAWGITPLGAMAEEAGAQDANPPRAREVVSLPEEQQAAGSDVSGDVTTLPTVTVQSEGYRATETRVGKVLQDPHDIPQAVTTITNTILEEQQVGSLREALRNVSGLTFNAAEGGRSGDNMMLRGFYTFGDMYLDGIRDTAQYNRETFNLEQVDVLRGSAAMLFGRGQAGGVINQVSKTPMLADRNKITGSAGSNRYFETTGDFNKVLGDTTAIRVNVMKRDEGSWRSNPATGTEAEIDRGGLAVSLGEGLGTDNEFILSHILTKTNDNPDYGISFDTNTREPSKRLPVNYFWNIEKNFDESDTNITTAGYTRRFGESEWRTQLRRAEYKRSYWAKTPNLTTPPDALAVTGGNQTRAMDYETITLQSDLNTKFNALGMEHEFLTGVEYLNEDSFRKGLQNFGGTTSANPPNYQPYSVATAGTATTFKSDSYAVYAQDTVEFIPQWKATVGARRDQMDAKYSSATSPSLKYGEWSTRAALSFQPTDETHYYIGFSDSFSPTADLYQLTVAPLPPERSQVLEVGLKKMFFDGDLAFRTALYRAVKDWERNADLESTAAILTKKRRTDGLEFELAGRVNDNWEVFSGLALMDARILEVAENVNATTGVITSGNPGYAGQRARNTPVYTFNVWSTYKLGGGWKVGGGVEAKGDRYGFNPSGAGAIPTLPGGTEFHPNTAPAYARWDGMVAYEQKKYTLRLNAQNLLNQVYYDSVYDNGGFTVPGTKRKIIVTAEFKF
jgi:catecholate siderophore receptor